MGLGTLTNNPWHTDSGWCTFQIGQCRLHIHQERTKEFYASQPKITENCSCDNCKYFETEVINQPNRLFEILKEMKVNLSRQPNIHPDGICCMDETKPAKLNYMGYYFVYGLIGKTSKKTKKVNEDNTVTEIGFNDIEFGQNTHVTVRQVEPDKLSFDFYMEVDGAIENKAP